MPELLREEIDSGDYSDKEYWEDEGGTKSVGIHNAVFPDAPRNIYVINGTVLTLDLIGRSHKSGVEIICKIFTDLMNKNTPSLEDSGFIIYNR